MFVLFSSILIGSKWSTEFGILE